MANGRENPRFRVDLPDSATFNTIYNEIPTGSWRANKRPIPIGEFTKCMGAEENYPDGEDRQKKRARCQVPIETW